MTLTTALVLLVVYYHHDEADWPYLVRSGTSLWLVTHWLRLVLSKAETIQQGKQQCSSLGVWRIHGQDYDLSEYVDQHPGGREAIMLGMNREDCTALFESYHPFTKENAQSVLRKYQRSNQQQAYKHTTDPFYQELCDKVVVALRFHGIDPIRDRTASRQRQLHYVVVILGVICSGFFHFKVRMHPTECGKVLTELTG